MSAGVEAVLCGLLALAGAALIARLALACPAVALPTCCRGRDLSDPADSQATLPLPMLGEHHPPCAHHTTLKEVLQDGVV